MVALKPKKSAVPDPGPKTSRAVGKGGPPSMGGRGVHAPLAKGGATSMHGKGDRTTTAPTDAAGTQHSGSTAHKTSSRGSLLAAGGKGHLGKQAADPAPPGRTAKANSAADPKQAFGGLARPARPGQCGT
jgi:hypothetical protein